MNNYSNNSRSMNGLNNINANSLNSNEIDVDILVVNVSASVPTMPALNNSLNVANTAFVTNAVSNINISNYVTLGTTQIITGEKSFSNANTYISGNTVTNSIQSSNPVNNINIGTQLTTGDVNIGTSASIGQNVALNWGTTNNGGTLTFRGGAFNFISSGFYVQRSGATTTMWINDTQSTGLLEIGHMATRSGIININTGATSTAPLNISSATTVNAPITIGSSASTTQTATHNALTTFTQIPNCSIVPTTGNNLCNKTYVDSLSSNLLPLNNSWTGTNAFSNTLTSSSVLTIKNGASAQTATLTQNTTTLDIIGVGDISIKPTNDFNVLTGAGKNINISNPDTASAPSQTTITTDTNNVNSYILFKSPTVYTFGSNINPSFIIAGGHPTAYGLKFTRSGTQSIAVNRINCSNTGDTLYLEVNGGTNIALTNNTTTLNSNLFLNQTTIPSSNSSSLGYTVTATSAEFTFTANILGNVQSFTVPSKGVWLVITNLSQRTTGAAGTITSRRFLVATSNTSDTPVGTALYFEENDDSVGGNTIRMVETIQTVISATASTTYYVNATFTITGVTAYATATTSFTRIG